LLTQVTTAVIFNLERHRYVRHSLQGSGVIGIILTVFIYVVTMLLAAFLLYLFLLHLHLNGRMVSNG
jgi:hypothetical protein